MNYDTFYGQILYIYVILTLENILIRVLQNARKTKLTK